MVVDIFYNDTLQRMRFYDSQFLTKRKWDWSADIS